MHRFEDETLGSLHHALADFRPPSSIHLDQDRWVLGSLLQKAIRRNEPEWALPAAATLLIAESRWLWRRLAVVALEDIAFGNIGLVAQVLVAAKNVKPFPEDWKVVSFLVERMCSSSKCRALNDLVEIGAYSTRTGTTLSAFQGLSFDDLLFVTSNQAEDILSRYLALAAIALPLEGHRTHPELNESRFLAGLGDFHFTPEIRYSIHRGLTALRLGHSLALAVLTPHFEHGNESALEDDTLPPVELLDGVPSYAFDMHTRAGANAIRRFLRQSNDVKNAFCDAGIDSSLQYPLLRHCMFDLESGLMKRRLVDPISISLRREAESLGFGRTTQNCTTLMKAIRQSWADYQHYRARSVETIARQQQ